jgi:hypothetical protein
VPEATAVGALYLERLSERDLRLLADGEGSGAVARLRAEPARICERIASPDVYDALFAPWVEEPLVLASPLLVFSVLLAQTARELGESTHIREWFGPGRRIPVFDVEGPRAFAEDPLRRLFLAEVLASYTHVVSGSLLVRTRRGWTRRRFSELDPLRLAELLEVVPPFERPMVYRRLGDLALFLTGVFPDHAHERLFRPVQVERITRLLGPGVDTAAEEGAVGLLERVGRHAYGMAAEGIETPAAGLASVLAEMPERFADARRLLFVLTERHLFPRRERWFGG